MIWVFLITAVLVITHLASSHIGKRLDRAKHAAHSFGGGMAIAYVFLHLLPELEKGHRVFGHSVHLVALCGFILFYVAEHWAENHPSPHVDFKFRILLHSIYNWLIIYSLPEAIEEGLGYALLLSITLTLHLLSSDYHLRSINPIQFHAWGRWALAAALVAGFITDIFQEPVIPQVADTWTALLSGFVLSNVFRNESPDHKTGQLVWFLAGALLYSAISMAVD